MEIFRAQIQHLEALQLLGIRTFKTTFENTCRKEDMAQVLATFFDTETMKEELTNPNDYFFIAQQNNEYLGYMRLQVGEAPFVEIENYYPIELKRLYVDTQFHGTSVAQQLMDFAIEFAIQLKHKAIYLSVWEYNFKARGFYEKNGFKDSEIKCDFPLGNTPQTDYWYWRSLG